MFLCYFQYSVIAISLKQLSMRGCPSMGVGGHLANIYNFFLNSPYPFHTERKTAKRGHWVDAPCQLLKRNPQQHCIQIKDPISPCTESVFRGLLSRNNRVTIASGVNYLSNNGLFIRVVNIGFQVYKNRLLVFFLAVRREHVWRCGRLLCAATGYRGKLIARNYISC